MPHLKKALLRKTAVPISGLHAAAKKPLSLGYKAEAIRHSADPIHMAATTFNDPMSAASNLYHGAEAVEMGAKATPRAAAGAKHAYNAGVRIAPHVKAGGAAVGSKVQPAAQAIGSKIAPVTQAIGSKIAPYTQAIGSKVTPVAQAIGNRIGPTAQAIGTKLAPVTSRVAPYMNSTAIAQGAKRVAAPAWAASMIADASTMGLKDAQGEYDLYDPATMKIDPNRIGQNVLTNTNLMSNGASNRLDYYNDYYKGMLGNRAGGAVGTAVGLGANGLTQGFLNPGRTLATTAISPLQTAGNAGQAVAKLGPRDFANYMTSARTAVPAVENAGAAWKMAGPNQRFIWEDGKRKLNTNFEG